MRAHVALFSLFLPLLVASILFPNANAYTVTSYNQTLTFSDDKVLESVSGVPFASARYNRLAQFNYEYDAMAGNDWSWGYHGIQGNVTFAIAEDNNGTRAYNSSCLQFGGDGGYVSRYSEYLDNFDNFTYQVAFLGNVANFTLTTYDAVASPEIHTIVMVQNETYAGAYLLGGTSVATAPRTNAVPVYTLRYNETAIELEVAGGAAVVESATIDFTSYNIAWTVLDINETAYLFAENYNIWMPHHFEYFNQHVAYVSGFSEGDIFQFMDSEESQQYGTGSIAETSNSWASSVETTYNESNRQGKYLNFLPQTGGIKLTADATPNSWNAQLSLPGSGNEFSVAVAFHPAESAVIRFYFGASYVYIYYNPAGATLQSSWSATSTLDYDSLMAGTANHILFVMCNSSHILYGLAWDFGFVYRFAALGAPQTLPTLNADIGNFPGRVVDIYGASLHMGDITGRIGELAALGANQAHLSLTPGNLPFETTLTGELSDVEDATLPATIIPGETVYYLSPVAVTVTGGVTYNVSGYPSFEDVTVFSNYNTTQTTVPEAGYTDNNSFLLPAIYRQGESFDITLEATVFHELPSTGFPGDRIAAHMQGTAVITFAAYSIPTGDVNLSLIDSIVALVAPIVVALVFPLALYQVSKKTLFAIVGFILGAIVGGLSGTIPPAPTILLCGLGAMLMAYQMRKERGGGE